MHSRSYRCWRTPLLILATILLALAPIVQAGDDATSVQPGKSAVAPKQRAPLYPRLETFWGHQVPDYGALAPELAESPDALFFPVGSFLTTGPELAFSSDLLAPGTTKGPSYFVIQFKPAAMAADRLQSSLQEITATGATLIEYVPQNGFIVKADATSYPALSATGLLQYSAPYHPGYKILPGIGTSPLPDPEAAASSVYRLYVRAFPDVKVEDVQAEIERLGGHVVVGDQTGDGPNLVAYLDKSKILPLAQVEGIRDINESLPAQALGEENAWNVIAGTYVIGQKPSLYDAGVYGAGGPGTRAYQKDVDVNPAGIGSPPAAGVGDSDWNGNGLLDNAAQIIGIADTGMAVDAGDFADTATDSGWLGGASCTAGQGGGTGGPNVGVFGGAGANGKLHRKLVWYEKAVSGFGNGTCSGGSNPGTACPLGNECTGGGVCINGDLCSCDPGSSHGSLVSSQAAGSASFGPFTADGIDWHGDGTIGNYGTPFLFSSGPTTYRVDGVAPGARIAFQDMYRSAACPEPTPVTVSTGVYNTLLGEERAKGARIGLDAFGTLTFTAGQLPNYALKGSSIDTFLSTDANRDFMYFVSAGNFGSGTANTNFYQKANTITSEASAKNAVTVGGVNSGTTGDLNALYFETSAGPAPNGQSCSSQTASRAAASNCGRIKPDVLAPGIDPSDIGLQESFSCASNDNDQVAPIVCKQVSANTSTSFSAANAAGAGALIRDYFAQGLYPDGTSANVGNDTDRKSVISGALVKALIIASAQHAAGDGNRFYEHRFNIDEGYGFINLRNSLPLSSDPATPTGLIVHDAGLAVGGPGPSNISLPLTLAQSTTAIATFDVVNTSQPLKAVLTWIEGQGQTLINNLDMELRYCGPDGNCTTTGGVCAFGVHNTKDGTACTADTDCCCPGSGAPANALTCGNGAPTDPLCQRGSCNQDKVYYGNVFTEDLNDDGTEDVDLDGLSGMPPIQTAGLDHWRAEGAWSLANKDANLDGTATGSDAIPPRDTNNNTEGIFLSNDPEGDGTDIGHLRDTQVLSGKWQVKLAHTAVGTDAQRYALVIAGGVTVESNIRIDTNPISCNSDLAVIVSEVPKAFAVDPGCCTTGGGCPVSTCTADTIAGRVDIYVKTPGGVIVDREEGLTFTKDPKDFGYTSVRIPVSTAVAGNPSGAPSPTDGILLAADGYTVTAVYRDTVSPNTIERTSTATFNCTPNVDFFPVTQPGRNQKFLLAGGCDTDTYFDNGETFTYRVRFANLEDTLTLEDIVVTLRAVVPDTDNVTDPGRLNNATSSFVSIPIPTVRIQRVEPGFLEDASFTVLVTGSPAWTGSTDPPPTVEMVVGVTSQKSGKTSAHYQAFSHILNSDDNVSNYSSDYPTGATVDRDINNNERIENPIHDPRNPYPQCPAGQKGCVDQLNETVTYASLKDTSFGGGNPAFVGPWNFDTSDDDFRTGLYPQSKGNGPDTTEWGEDHDYDNHLSGPYFCVQNPGAACACAGNPDDGCDDPTCPGLCSGDHATLCSTTPQCGGQCVGGTNPGVLCPATSCTGGGTCVIGGGTCALANCVGGTNANNACTTNANCPGGGHCPRRCEHEEDYDGNQDGTLNENWGLTGACGWNSSTDASHRGIWHTGTIGPAPLADCSNFGETNCENFDTLPGNGGSNFWVEFLRTPLITKVHPNYCHGGSNPNTLCTNKPPVCVGGLQNGLPCPPATCTGGGTCQILSECLGGGTCKSGDARGLDYKFQLTDWRWNVNADHQQFRSSLTWEWDDDADNTDPVDLNDGFVFINMNQGTGPISNGNVGYLGGFPLFVANDPDNDGTFGTEGGGPFSSLNGTNTSAPNRNRAANRSCFFSALNASQANLLLHLPGPPDDDCDNDIVSLGADGCPGSCGIDDDEDNAPDNAEEACPCFARGDSLDNDADGRIDEPDEIQRYYRCSGATSTYCKITGFNTDDCGGTCVGGSNPGAPCGSPSVCLGGGTCSSYCGHFGNGKPKAYGDDTCGDGSLDEGVSATWVDTTGASPEGELGHRLSQTQNYSISVTGYVTTILRFQTIEDDYDRESGNRVQGSLGFIAFEGDSGLPAVQSYGVSVDDMTIEWTESVPNQQQAGRGCGGGTCASGARIGKVCFNGDDCGKTCVGGTAPPNTDCTFLAGACTGGGTCTNAACSGATGNTCLGGSNNGTACTTDLQCTGGGYCSTATASCAALSWGTTNLFSGSGVIALNLVDFNASTTQGTFDCTKYGFTAGCAGGVCSASNDCDNNGLREVEVQVTSSQETAGESFRLERLASGSTNYTGNVTFSSAISAANDGVVFMQYNGGANPLATAIYFDKDSGNADVNGDGTSDSPPNNGKDKCPGLCGNDDNKNAVGPDKRPGAGLFNDDGNGVCDFKSATPGLPCATSAGCGGGNCLSEDEPDELCGRTCTAGTTSGVCSASSSNPNTVCNLGVGGTCLGGGTCVAINCSKDSDCGGSGNCIGRCYNGDSDGTTCHQLSDCTAGAVGGFCGPTPSAGGRNANGGWGDDNCHNIDELAELCAFSSGNLVAGIDDNCGCSSNPIQAVLNAFFNTGDLIVETYSFADNSDHDGFADDNELVTVTLRLRNLGTVDIDDVHVRLSSQSPEIACINDPTAAYGRINKHASANNLDTLSFTVGNVNRTALGQLKQATLVVTATGTLLGTDGSRLPIEGTTIPQSFTFDLDLDSSGTAPIAKTTKIFGFEKAARCAGGTNNAQGKCVGGTNAGAACTQDTNCNSNVCGACTSDADCPGGSCPVSYPSKTAWESDWFHSYVADKDGLHCQQNDPSGLHVLTVPVACTLRQDAGTAVPDDWHLHSDATGGTPSWDLGRDSGTPGKCINGKAPNSVCSSSADCFGACLNGKAPGSNCLTAADCPGACSNDTAVACTAAPRCRFCNNDHSIVCTAPANCSAVGGLCGAAGSCTNPSPGTCTNPGPGTCVGVGNACLHEGFHSSSAKAGDTVHLDNMFYTYYPNTVTGPPGTKALQLGLGRPGTDDPPLLDFWQQIALVDDRSTIAPGIGVPPFSDEAAVVQILVDRDNDGTQESGPPTDSSKDGWWEKPPAFYGAPQVARLPYRRCAYDPDDDGNNEDDLDDDLAYTGLAKGPSSTCYPEFVWGCIGDTIDYKSTPSGTAAEDTPGPICFPEVDASENPIYREGNGPGSWAEAKIDLSKYKGKKIWLRLFTTHVQWTGSCTWSGLGCPVTTNGGNRDDGWYIDDIRISGTSTPFDLKPDTDTPPATSCPAQLCNSLIPKVSGSTYLTQHDGVDNDGNSSVDEEDDAAYDTVHTDAPLRGVLLNAQDFDPSTGICINGVLQYRFWEDLNNNGTFQANELLRDFTENATATANPLCSETIKMDIRCSSAPNTCVPAPASLRVIVEGSSFTITVGVDKTTFSWPSQLAATSYDVAVGHNLGPDPLSSANFSAAGANFRDPHVITAACVTGCGIATTTYNSGGACNLVPTGPLPNCNTLPGTQKSVCGKVDMWAVRSKGGTWVSWDEGGNQIGTRDAVGTGIPACP